MKKVIGMLVALAMFCAVPGIAFAGTSEDGGSDSGNEVDAPITSGDAVNEEGDGGVNTNGGGGTGGTGETGETVENGEGDEDENEENEENGNGDINCQIAQSAAAGGDVSQEAINKCGNVFGQGGGQGVGQGGGQGQFGQGGGGQGGGGQFGQGGGQGGGGGGQFGQGGGGVGGGGVQSVQLARTGFDAWMLALLGGLSLAGGLGLLVAQRRGRIGA